VKVMSAEAVATELLLGIADRKLHVVPGHMGKITHLLKRHAPRLVDWFLDSDLKRYRQNHPR
jgi:hypothetical protein